MADVASGERAPSGMAGRIEKNPRLVSRLRHVHAFKRQKFCNVRRDVGCRLRAVIRVQPGAASLIGRSETACADSGLAASRQSKGPSTGAG